MRFHAPFSLALLACLLLPIAASAEPRAEWEELQRLQPTDQQVEAVFSLFLGRLPSLLKDSQDRDLVGELAPQALQLLTPAQRQALSELAPREQVERIGSMTEAERTRFFFDAAQSLIHPSKKEWLQRMEELTEPQGR